MRQSNLTRTPIVRVLEAPGDSCLVCGGRLEICQHRSRVIHLLDETLDLTMKDKRCRNPDCPRPDLRYRPPEVAMLALPKKEFGLDVTMAIGSMRFRDDFSFPRIHRRLRQRHVPISAMSVQYYLRDYMSLVHCQVGLQKGKVRARLREQGAIIPVIDGVQFAEGDPVLYLATDALSGLPLLGEEMICRSADDLVPFIAQLNDIGVPILGVVSDKERGLVPAIAEALPRVPHQYCQVHYVKNAAKPMEEDLSALGEEVRETEQELRKLQRDLLREEKKLKEAGDTLPGDHGVTLELCDAARDEARRTARAPLNPPALKRHQGLEKIAEAVADARRKKGVDGKTSPSWQ